MATFSNAREWDPGVVEGKSATGGPLRVGSAFEIVSKFMGRRVPLRYEITAFEPLKKVVVEAPSGSFRSIDTMTFEPSASGCRVTYDARLVFSGLSRIADPLMQVVFWRVGSAAKRGLEKHLNP